MLPPMSQYVAHESWAMTTNKSHLWLVNFILERLSQSTVRVKSGRLKWIFGNVSVYTFSKLWSDMYFWVRICINYSQHIMLVDVIRTSSERNQVWIYTNRTFAVFQKPKIHHSLFLRMRIHWNDEQMYQRWKDFKVSNKN